MDQAQPLPSAGGSEIKVPDHKPPSTLRRVGAYAVVRILTIGITIAVGIFLAVVVANKGGGIDTSMEASLRTLAQREIWSMVWYDREDLSAEERLALENQIFNELAEEAGLYESFFKKHMLWTVNALKLDLGEAIYTRVRATYATQQEREQVKAIILSRLPNTLALVGVADFFVFVIGIPLSLYLSRNYGNLIDKIINILSPLSSVPSWVHGVLLILIFAVTLKILPPGGMYDIPLPDTKPELFISRLKHMILPALAIFLSLLFQLVYTWRNYFMIYSNEDYVEFAVARGLSGTALQNNYILKPALPYVLTSFALTLVTFWQMATALEIVFNWDGIGKLYIISLPNFWGESMFPGEMGLTIGIVVIFAYILGMVVLLLDIAYAIVDPRIRLGGQEQRIRPTKLKRNFTPLNWIRALSSFSLKPSTSSTQRPDAAVKAVNFNRRRNIRLSLIILLFLIAGILLGLAFGWWIWPVEYTNASPADLSSSHQMDYIRIVIDSFNNNQNSGLAHQRLNALGENASLAMQKFIESVSSNSSAKNALVSFANAYDPNAGYTASPGSSMSQEITSSIMSRIITLGLMLVSGIAFFWVAITLYLKLVNRPARRKKSDNYIKKKRDTKVPSEQIISQSPFQRRLKRLAQIFQELIRYPSAVAGMIILAIMVTGSLYAVIRYPYAEIGAKWYQDASDNSKYVPRTAYPKWINTFRNEDLPETIILNTQDMPETTSVKILDNGNPDYTFTLEFDYPYQGFPTEGMLYFETEYKGKQPFATFTWFTPDGREFRLKNAAIDSSMRYYIDKNLDRRQLTDHQIQYKYQPNDLDAAPVLYGLFADPDKDYPVAVSGTYTLEIKVLAFEPDTSVDVEMVLMGKIYGLAGTDYMRRDLIVPMLWGMPFALGIGLVGALLTTIVSMLFAAFGVWFGGWADNLVQRVTEANMILPVVAIAVLFYAFYGASLWSILLIIVVLNAFGSPTKTFRAAFIQVKESSYIEAAQAYGAPNRRIIFRYMIPRILPVLIPQLVTLIPGFIFLEATLGMFNVKSNLPTWGKVIYEALAQGAAWGSKFWVLEPITLLLLTGFAFSMMGFALDRVLNPRLQQGD